MRIYQAGPLFSEADQNWHRALKAKLQAAGFDVCWPFELFAGSEPKEEIFKGCLEALLASDLVVALLDGAQVDDGTAWEIGCAHHAGIPVVGVRTDFRQAGDCQGSMCNAMIECSCRRIVRSVPELIDHLRRPHGLAHPLMKDAQ